MGNGQSLRSDRKDSPKDIIPDLGSNAETELEVLVMMSEMVFFHFGEVLRELRVMQCVVHAIVQDVESVRARDDAVSDCLGEEKMSELGEGVGKDEEKSGWHDETKFIHRQVVMNTMQQEVQRQRNVVIR